jgi:hypothetical protein
MIPGRKPSSVNKILSQKAPFKPTVKNTPRGGRKMANKILKIVLNRDVFSCLLIVS